jgi:hypothetical protein
MELKPGGRFRSAVCDVEVVVVRSPPEAVTLECGGHTMIPLSQPRPEGLTLAAEHAQGALPGKRYDDAETGLEVLCSKRGAGTLSVDGRPLALREAKKLPSSD